MKEWLLFVLFEILSTKFYSFIIFKNVRKCSEHITFHRDFFHCLYIQVMQKPMRGNFTLLVQATTWFWKDPWRHNELRTQTGQGAFCSCLLTVLSGFIFRGWHQTSHGIHQGEISRHDLSESMLHRCHKDQAKLFNGKLKMLPRHTTINCFTQNILGWTSRYKHGLPSKEIKVSKYLI